MIQFVTGAGRTMASFRYRVECVQEALLMQGHEVKVAPTLDLSAKQAIFSKHFNPVDYSDAIAAKALGCRVVFDVCDDHRNTKFADHYDRMIRVADCVTANSDEMASRIWDTWHKRAHVIPDPIIYEPIDRVPDLTKTLWFGATWTLDDTLYKHIGTVSGDLEICTGPTDGISRPNTTFTLFSPEEQQKAFRRNGIAFIPYADSDEALAKSANRIIEALNASMVVVTNGIPAAKELMPFVELHHRDVGPHSVRKMEQGRQFVRQRYSVKQIVKLWKKALDL